jgi:exodeoxyribonuclease V beta subunit
VSIPLRLPLPLRPPDPPAFDLHAPLPSGVTLLEASAGTGKTFTIAALTARYVAAGVPLEQLLVVTFTRLATGELRDRVRERLVLTAEGLATVASGGAVPAGDELVGLLADADPEELARRLERLDRAVAEFDAATIDTTHGFCLQVLTGLGVTGDVDAATSLVEQVDDLLDEVVDDLYVRRFMANGELRFGRKDARRVAGHALGNPGARVLPELSRDRTPAAIRRRLVKAVTEEMDRRKRAAGFLTYDDLLTRLRDTLAHPRRGEAACGRLRSRYRVVLVDEFQDTDPVQWEILRRAFADGGTTLVLIGDPKQAIYAFRGADVYAYLDAAAQAGTEWTLRVNWRSDEGLLDALDLLFDGCQLGHAGIVHRRVEPAPGHHLPRLVGGRRTEPLLFRILDRRLVEKTRNGYAVTANAREVVAADLAAEVSGLLTAGAEILTRDEAGEETGRRAVRPGDVAVLVRTNAQARVVREALSGALVPAVLGGGGSVFSTPAAEEWLRLFEALERPTARDRAAAAALTTLVGWNASDVAGADDDSWEDFHWQLHRWASLLQRRGVAPLVEAVTAARRIPERVLGTRGGERYLTDVRHVGQLLHEEATTEGLGPTALVGWLRRRIAEADRDLDDVDRTLRLESDSEAVQVLTIHRSKGLEFPVVLCPFLWDHYSSETALPVFHDPDADLARTIDVAGEGAEFEDHKVLHRQEERGEDLRLMYVALTRARHRTVVWWAGSSGAGGSPIGRLLLARRAGGLVPSEGPRTPADREVLAKLQLLAEGSGGNVAVELLDRLPAADAGRDGERLGSPTDDPPLAAAPAADDLAAARFDRTLDRTWRRTSFSGITARSHVPLVGSEHDEAVTVDERAASEVPAAGGPGGAGAGGSAPLLLGPMPGGVRVGTALHQVLEQVDFTSPDLESDLRQALAAETHRDLLDLGDLDVVALGLRTAIEAPLGPLAGGLRLRDVRRADRVDEMSFELPLAGGDTAGGLVGPADLAAVLRAHVTPDDPVAGYAARLADPTLEQEVRGYLTGSLDLVVRLPGPRFVIADYKTNRLSPDADVLTAWHYRPEAIEAEMLQAHYPLQAILYTVALHRYLRWRLRGYDPGRHLGGVLYLFLRGMSAVEAPPAGSAAAGVWSWQPSVVLVEALSDLFDRGAGR